MIQPEVVVVASLSTTLKAESCLSVARICSVWHVCTKFGANIFILGRSCRTTLVEGSLMVAIPCENFVTICIAMMKL